jgi:hypothetical protein
MKFFLLSPSSPLNPLPNRYWFLFLRGQSSRGVRLTTHLQLVPRSRICWPIHPLPHKPSCRGTSLVEQTDKCILWKPVCVASKPKFGKKKSSLCTRAKQRRGSRLDFLSWGAANRKVWKPLCWRSNSAFGTAACLRNEALHTSFTPQHEALNDLFLAEWRRQTKSRSEFDTSNKAVLGTRILMRNFSKCARILQSD